MEDSFIIANFHTLCRLCLNKSTFTTSIFAAAPDDETNVSLTSKLAECFELQVCWTQILHVIRTLHSRIIRLLIIFVTITKLFNFRLILMMGCQAKSVISVCSKWINVLSLNCSAFKMKPG